MGGGESTKMSIFLKKSNGNSIIIITINVIIHIKITYQLLKSARLFFCLFVFLFLNFFPFIDF